MTPTPTETVLERLRQCECHPRKQTHGWESKCPAHEDRKPSLSITDGDGNAAGGVILFCHAGCSPEDICSKLGLTLADLFPPRDPNASDDPVAVYPYTDETGTLLYEVVRKVGKRFLQRKPDGAGGYEWRLNGVRRVLYQLPDVLAAVAEGRPVWIAEGERDVAALRAAGVCATCNSGGAGKWSKEFAPWLTGAAVVVVADKDDPGRAHARTIAESLSSVAANVRVVEAAIGKDAADHLGAGLGLDAFVPQGPPDQAHAAEEDAPRPPLIIRDLADVAADVDAAPPPTFLAEPIWPADAYGIIAAEDKAGKTWAILDLAVSVASGTAWMGLYPCPPGDVLVFLGEGGERKMVRRLRAVAAARGLAADALPIRVCFRVPHLTKDDHVKMVRAELESHPARLVIVDPLYLAARGANASQLYEMGEHLERLQLMVQEFDSALVIATHFKKASTEKTKVKAGPKGKDDITGVGPAAWGRVIATADLDRDASSTDPETGETKVVLHWQFRGDEIPDTDISLTRTVRAEDLTDLRSPMHYSIEQTQQEEQSFTSAGTWRPTIYMERVSRVLADGIPRSGRQIRDLVKGEPTTISTALEVLVTEGYVSRRKEGRAQIHEQICGFNKAEDEAARQEER